MLVLEEFANFITMNMANLAETYVEELNKQYPEQNLPADTCLVVARRLLKAVALACKTEKSDPLIQLLGPNEGGANNLGPLLNQCPGNGSAPQTLVALENLDRTLTPVVTNLDAGKFLWQIMAEIRRMYLDAMSNGGDTLRPAFEPQNITNARHFLSKRAEDLETIALISTTVSTILEPDKLLQQVVDQVKQRLNLYHAHIYLLDDAGDVLNLAAGAGDVGRRMVKDGWRIPLARQQSLVARAARSRQPVVINNVRTEPGYFQNPLLPLTRSEVALPLLVADTLLGVLDVQADTEERFTDEDVSIKKILASQVAVALQNARLYDQAQHALADTQQSQALLRNVIDATPDWILVRDRGHRYRLVNRAYARALHLTPQDFIGKTDTEVGLPDEFVTGELTKGIRGILIDDDEVLTSGESVVNPFEPLLIDNELRLFHSIKTPLQTADGETWGVLTLARDVTEREYLLTQTETLYQASVGLNLAQTHDDILGVLEQYTMLGQGTSNLSLNYFDIPWTKTQTPHWIHTAARRSRLPLEAVRDHYALTEFPSADQLLQADAATLIENVADDPRMDENARTLYRRHFGAKSTIFVPLVIGGQWLGFINAVYPRQTTFPDGEVRRMMILAGHVAVAMQAIQQLQTTERRARREQTIRQITDKMRSATNLPKLLQITAEELAHHLSAEHAVIEMGIDPAQTGQPDLLEKTGQR